jgi:hypothetical protein
MTAEIMSADEYAAAREEIRRLQSYLTRQELDLIQAQLNPQAQARIAQLRRRAAEDKRMGPERLAAATAESAAYDKRQARKKQQRDHDTKQHKDDTTHPATSHAPRTGTPSLEAKDWDDCQHGQEALSCSSTSSRAVSAFEPAGRDHSAAA